MSRRKTKNSLLNKNTVGWLAIGLSTVLFLYVLYRDVTVSNYFGMGEDTIKYLSSLLTINISIFPIVLVDFLIGIICLKLAKDNKFKGINYLLILVALTALALFIIFSIYPIHL